MPTACRKVDFESGQLRGSRTAWAIAFIGLLSQASCSGLDGLPTVIRSAGGEGGQPEPTGGSAPSGNPGPSTGGSVLRTDDTGGVTQTGGAPEVKDPCAKLSCGPGQRCEVDGETAICIDQTCEELACSDMEDCEPHPDGGFVCVSLACRQDVDCDPSEYCDGSVCVPDACVPGEQQCSSDQVLECPSNGAPEAVLFTCVSPAYFAAACVATGGATAVCTCEDDWDCPENTVCEVDRCAGNGSAPSCALPPLPFADVPPAVEMHWGAADRLSVPTDGTVAAGPVPWPEHVHVLNTPIVANLDDDNGDGLINELDFPEIVFIAHDGDNIWRNGVVRAVHGGGPRRGADYFARCADELWTEANPVAGDCPEMAPDADSGAPVAVGDLDYDGVPEIIYATESDDNRFKILNNKGELLYELSVPWNEGDTRGETIAIANLDYAGYAEIIVGRDVYVLGPDAGGSLTVTHILTGAGARGCNDEDGGGPFSRMACPADVHPEPGQEIVVGATLYGMPATLPTCATPPCTGDLTVLWDAVAVGGIQGAAISGEGFCAVADVWGADSSSRPGPLNPPDGDPEVILIDDGSIVILSSATGQLIHQESLGGERGGAPNVDDFDGDGFMEVASALEDFYVVVDLQEPTAQCPAWPLTLGLDPTIGTTAAEVDADINLNPARVPGGECSTDADCAASAVCNTQKMPPECVCLHNGWSRYSDDNSSRATSSSVFDFNGDGAAEVVYNDECNLRVYDGVSGRVLASETNRSRTGIENVTVADVDNDGNAEIVMGSNTDLVRRCDFDGADFPTGPVGLRVWGDPSDTWVSARRIWNQQSYHVTNVTESGAIPMHAPESWGSFNGRVYNTFRSQPRSFGVAPDLVVVAVGVYSPDVACGQLSDIVEITFEIRNDGSVRVGPGVLVAFTGQWGAEESPLLDAAGAPLVTELTASLEPGRSVVLAVRYDRANNAAGVLPDLVRVTVDAGNLERECVEDNNTGEAPVDPGERRPDLTIELGAARSVCPDGEVDTIVTNEGSVEVSNIVVHFYAGDPAQGGTFLAEHVIAGPLAAGASESFTMTFKGIPVERAITVWGVVDPDNAIPECNESDNRDPADDELLCHAPIL